MRRHPAFEVEAGAPQAFTATRVVYLEVAAGRRPPKCIFCLRRAATAVLRERLVLRGYGAKNEAEFFAVATEAFFEKPRQRAVDEVVKVDFYIPGCPPPADIITYVLTELLSGRTPNMEGRSKYG